MPQVNEIYWSWMQLKFIFVWVLLLMVVSLFSNLKLKSSLLNSKHFFSFELFL